MSSAATITPVSDTARWVALYRAMEFRAPQAHTGYCPLTCYIPDAKDSQPHVAHRLIQKIAVR